MMQQLETSLRVTAVAFALLIASCANAPVRGLDSVGPAVASALERDPLVTTDVADMPAGEYVLDPRHTSVLWRVRHWGLSPFTGRFDSVSGRLSLDGANPENSTVSVRIPLASVNTGILNREGERAFDRDIATYLGGATYPDIVFESRSIDLTGPTTGRITGDLTFNGRTHPVVLDAVFEGGRVIPTNNRPTLAFTARAIFRRSLWLEGVPPLHNSLSPGDQVEIIISAEFARPPVQQPQGQ